MITRRRQTVARAVELEGRGLHEGLSVRVRLLPAPAARGVCFVRADLPGAPIVEARIRCVGDRPRRTVLASGDAEVHTVEHLLAAVYGLGLTDLVIELDGIEVPASDGSAYEFAMALREAGTDELAGVPECLCLDRVVCIEAVGARIVARPAPGRLVVEYHLEYSEDVPPMVVAMEVTPEGFMRELAPARTFCLEREARALRAAGLGKGATTGNTLVIGPSGQPMDNELRFDDEYARHKLLDLLGDLCLLGAGLEAHVVAYRSGHSLNAELVRRLRELLDGAGRGADVGAVAAAHRHEERGRSGYGEATPREGAERADSILDDVAVADGVVQASFLPPVRAFDGHFPHQPVLPGVLSLAAIEEAVLALARPQRVFGDGSPRAAGRECHVRGLRAVRFRRVVGPGERLRVDGRRGPDGSVSCRIVDDHGRAVVEGRFEVGA
ncbi:UDP-3-O-acyl-N-acetylglucosamine deacetylase [Planctomycetota bacterium]